MTDLKAQLLNIVLKKAYIRSKIPFKLASGKTSFDYVDMRCGLSNGNDLKVACLYLAETLKASGYDFATNIFTDETSMSKSFTDNRSLTDTTHKNNMVITSVGGMTMGADPISHGVSLLTGINWFSVRKQSKDHGTQNSIEGYKISNSDSVLLVDDTVTSGTSLIKAAQQVLSTGASITIAVCILDRSTLAKSEFEKLGIRYIPLLTFEDLKIEPV